MVYITIIDRNNKLAGPFSRAQIDAKLAAGEITADTLAFVAGLTDWKPLRDVLAKVKREGERPKAPPVSNIPRATPTYRHGEYADFSLRFVAYVIDYLIVHIPMSLLLIGIIALIGGDFKLDQNLQMKNADGSMNDEVLALQFGFSAVTIIITWLYFALQESSPAQATLGKRALGLCVTDLFGHRITFGEASGRHFGKLLSAAICMIGFLMAAFTLRKQALHDKIAGTLVIRPR